MMAVRFTITALILLTFEALSTEAFPAAGPLASALNRKSVDPSLAIPVASAFRYEDVSLFLNVFNF